MGISVNPKELKDRLIKAVALCDNYLPENMQIWDCDVHRFYTKIMLSSDDNSSLPWTKREYDEKRKDYRLSYNIMDDIEIFKYASDSKEEEP